MLDCTLSQADLAKTFLRDVEFLEDAACQAKRMAEKAVLLQVARPLCQPSGCAPTSDAADNAKIQEQPNRKKRKFESPPDEATWWSTLGKQSKEEALREFREHGESRKLTMTAKNFASRVYKQPQFTSVDMRRAAHRDAREYIESLAKPETS